MLEEPIRMSSGCERLQNGTADAFNGHVTNPADSYNGHVAGAASGYQAPLHSPPPPPQVSPPSQQRSSPLAAPVEDRGRDRDSLYAQYGYPPPLLGGGYSNSNSYTEKLHDGSNANGINNGSSADRGINDNGSINGESRHESRDAGGPPHQIRPECNPYSPNSSSQFVPPKPEPEVATPAGYVGTGDVGSDDRRSSPPIAVADGSPMLRVRDLTSRSDSVLRFSERRPSISEPDNGSATEASAPPPEPDQDTSGTSKPASHSSDPSEYEHPAEDDVDRSREAYEPDGYDNNGDNFGTNRGSYDGNRESYDSRDAFGNTVDAFGREKAGEIDTRGEGVPGLNALARLQHALEKNGTFNVYKDDNAGVGGGEIYQCHLCSYTGSSKFHFSQHMHSHYDFKCSQCDFSTHSNITLKDHMKEEHNIEIKDFMDEPGVRVPRVNASGKVRLHKCKFCDFKTATQVEHWEHLKSHIAPEKRFWCHVCPFITDVKHHLTYHLRNHFNSKPFKCNKCEYSCVNKSMLSSHMKSHTNFYQYRCGDCNFAAKYANALKNHLRKEKHRPGMVLNPDGSPNPFVIIDVYGTRRGPKIKKDDNGMPILPTSLQENYVSFIQNQKTLMTSPNGSQFPSPYVKSEQQTLAESPDKLAIPRGFIRCDMCPYSTPDRDQLTKHMMNHMTPDSQQEASPASSKSGDDGRELAPQPPKELPGLGRMELLRTALAQPVRLNPPATSSPPPLPPPPPPAYRRPEPPQPPAELPRLPQYDSLAAHRVREYFSRALQTPFLYNLQVAAGLNNGSAPSAGLPLPFSMGRPGPPPPPPQQQHQSAAPPSPPHTRVSPRPSSPPFYERAPTQQQESPQPSSPPPGPDTALDLSRLGKRSSSDESPPPPAKHRRKGRAQKLEIISQRLQEGGGSPLYSTGSRAGSSSPERDVSTGDWKAAAHTCHSCGIAFKDLVMYTMHMGFHDYRRPFSCNKCGEECRDAIAFFLHIARVPHSS